jgi:hypothetical protein
VQHSAAQPTTHSVMGHELHCQALVLVLVVVTLANVETET